MKDRFGCEISPGDLLLYAPTKSYAKDLLVVSEVGRTRYFARLALV